LLKDSNPTMKTPLKSVIAALMILTAFTLARAAGIDGRWATEFDTQVGVQKYVYEFKTGADGTIAATAQWDRMEQKGTIELKEVKLDGDAISFVETFTIPYGDAEVRIEYKGKLAGDEMKLTRTVGDFAIEDLVAKRVTGEAAAVPAVPVAAAAPAASPARVIAPGPFQPTWESLAQGYQCPEWFRDAKFGIWAHWSAQCVPEEGDWYARNMYIQGTPNYAYHVAHYGHPSKFGFMELDNLWKAEKWEPEKLMALYKRAGAKYFVALANHHDNFDTYDSKYQPWNSVNVGPKKDIVGTWAKIARANGLRFGVSNHSSHAWHWFQPAYGHDVEGPLAGVPYDAATLTKADGKGKWWEGLDPQDLYCGLRIPMPNDLKTAKDAEAWHWKNDGHWYESVPPNDNGYTDKWFLRTQDLVDKYQPDLIYFDDDELPLGQAGLDIAAHYYNANAARNGGKTQAVLDAKHMQPAHRAAVVEDIERGVANDILPAPWQTDTCIGDWHYNRHVFQEHRYKTVGQVVCMLADIVSKNGNLLLSVPVRGNGAIDDDEVAFLEGMAKWMDVNGEAIFATRPWVVYGEGPSVTDKAEGGQFGGAKDVRSKPYTAEDIRFTTRGDALYAILLGWPTDKTALVKTLATSSLRIAGRKVTGVTLLGYSGKLTWTQDDAGLHVQLPATAPSEHAVALKITGVTHS
jgi:alpha-L-fucosidase